ncbi:MAG: PaaI family thioesterase [Melioribacteraceae bacterium]|nr:PaaI family thioesterase [Melioribacteraceae bacterium]
MKKVNNPFVGRENYNCFGCSPENNGGLKMEFWEDGEEVVCEWTPKDHVHGFHNVLHGGIQSTMMDEIASWYVFVKLKTAGVTSKLEVKYKCPVLLNKGNITLRAKLNEMKRNIADIYVGLYDYKGKLCAEGNIFYFTFDKTKAKEKLNYPEYEEFFNK